MKPMRAVADEVREVARTYALDHYLAALLARRASRDDLVVLAAFLGDVARIPLTVREPMLVEIRLQWWRDALEAPADTGDTGNPVADAMRDLARRHRLETAPIVALLEAQGMLVDQGSLADEAGVREFLGATEGTAMRLAARLAGADPQPWQEGLAAAARAYASCRMMRDSSRLEALGHLPLGARTGPAMLRDIARTELAQARARLAGAPRQIVDAALPAALVEPYLRALERRPPESGAGPGDIAPLSRVWRLWRAHRRGRIE